MKDLHFKLDSLHVSLGDKTEKLERLMTSIQWLDSDVFDKGDLPLELQDLRIQSELHCEVLRLYVSDLQTLANEVQQLKDELKEENKKSPLTTDQSDERTGLLDK